jgi:hypothetical protein
MMMPQIGMLYFPYLITYLLTCRLKVFKIINEEHIECLS